MSDAFLFTRDMVELWQHARACLAHADRSQCICGLTALQGIVDQQRHKVFTVTIGASSRITTGEPAPWHAISAGARRTMKELGHFGPTIHAANRTLKGYAIWGDDDDEAGNVYLAPGDLRRIAAGCLEVAAWLDTRAEIAESGTPVPAQWTDLK